MNPSGAAWACPHSGNTLPTAGIGLQPQLELSIEWATPFFLLDWSFQPQHPETLFLTDNACRSAGDTPTEESARCMRGRTEGSVPKEPE